MRTHFGLIRAEMIKSIGFLGFVCIFYSCVGVYYQATGRGPIGNVLLAMSTMTLSLATEIRRSQ